jgi:hypothetical protein
VSFTLRAGRLLRDGAPWRAVGVNYHPSVAGCRIWVDWDPVAADADFAAMAEHGLNTVRVFVFWRDVEPRQGHHDPVVLGRVRALAELAGRHGLACVLSACTIWMNGERLDLPWRAGRDLWRDPELVAAGAAYVRAVARALRGLDNVLLIDLGDEIGNVDQGAATLSRDDVAAWQAALVGAIHTERPDLLVCQANDVSGILGASPFGPDNAGALDLNAVHGWPLWTPGGLESTASVKASHLPAFLTAYAGAYGPALVDELGTYATGEQIAAGYQRAAGAMALATGAQGVLAWCWQDIASTAPPYDTRPAERTAGLRRLDATARPALGALTDTARLAALLADFRPDPPPVGLYLPEQVRTPSSSYVDSDVGTLGTFFASLLLWRAGLPHRIGRDVSEEVDLLVVPSAARLTLTDQARLSAHLARGGTVYLSVADHIGGLPDSGVTGIEPVDFALTSGDREVLRWSDGTSWPLDWPRAGSRRVVVRPRTATVVAEFQDASPACAVHDVGPGRMVTLLAPVELLLERPGALESGELHTLYARIAGLAGVLPTVTTPPGLAVITGSARGRAMSVLVNHGTSAVRFDAGVTVAGKGWTVLADGRVLSAAG